MTTMDVSPIRVIQCRRYSVTHLFDPLTGQAIFDSTTKTINLFCTTVSLLVPLIYRRKLHRAADALAREHHYLAKVVGTKAGAGQVLGNDLSVEVE